VAFVPIIALFPLMSAVMPGGESQSTPAIA
jgi:hypothetical protein